MQGKRLVGIFCGVLLCCVGLCGRIFVLSSGDETAAAADRNSTYTISIDRTRGMIYDSSLRPLLGGETTEIAVFFPGQESAEAIKSIFSDQTERQKLLDRLAEGKAFGAAIPAGSSLPASIPVFEVEQRYSSRQAALHVIGYTDGEGRGITGIERAYDSVLSAAEGTLQLRIRADALGRPLSGLEYEVTDTRNQSRKGVALTISLPIQTILQEAMDKLKTNGAAVVMEISTGKLRGVVSKPDYDPLALGDYLDRADAPFLNRAFAAFNVGSVFKIALAVAAHEKGMEDFTAFCRGSIDISGQEFGCHYPAGHGYLTLKTAIQRSCNPYFIALGQKLGGEEILRIASKLGFGSGTELCPGLVTESGNLPALQELTTPGAVASLSFGQGSLLATPIQLAEMMATIAGGGRQVKASLVEGITDASGTSIAIPSATVEQPRAIDREVAAAVTAYMVNMVEKSSADTLRPEECGGGGKTGTAETGWMMDGELAVQAWFAGFFPADNPKYAVAILAENGGYGAEVCGPIFKEIAEQIYFMEKYQEG
ncbi:MAG: penicillin-binding protein 2 [Ruminococcaceae bacterium]|nr:penicillin-binding protein 2 [Oscillospiraceae bacterium]